MGLKQFWPLLKDEDHSFPIAQLAEEHYEKHGRPLRIAIDEADWRFNNITRQQRALIQETSDEAYQGIDKNIFYRICKLLTLNIQLIFVFDGPRRPWKRGKRGGGKVDYAEIQLLEQTLRYFGIPDHRAPGEAEAECARMQQLGVVDAVFSQDSDALMFGCDYLIRDDRTAKVQGCTDRSKENTQKNAKTVRVVRGHEIRAKHNLDQEGLVLYAMLCGGDYNEQGLPKCGPALAKRAIKHGLGKSLFQCRNPADVKRWREELVDWLPRGFAVPENFPQLKTLVKYTSPTISTDEQLLDLNGVRNGWQQPIMELPLLRLTCDRFNIGGKRYLNWVGPVLLMRSFVAKHASQPRTNEHQLKLTKRMKKSAEQPEDRDWERKLTFSPFELTTLPRKDLEELWSDPKPRIAKNTELRIPELFDAGHRVTYEMPSYWLEKVLPLEVLEPPAAASKKTSRKRKQQTDLDMSQSEQPTPTPKKQRKSQKTAQLADASPRVSRARKVPASATPTTESPATTSYPTRSSHTPLNSRSCFIDLVSNGDEEESDGLEELDFRSARTIPAPTIANLPPEKLSPVPFRRTTASVPTSCSKLPHRPTMTPPLLPIRPGPSSVVDLIDNFEDSDDEDEQLILAIQLSLKEARPSTPQPGFPSSTLNQKLSDGLISWDEWEEDPDSLFVPQDSPLQMGTRALPVMSNSRISYAHPLQSTPPRNPTSKPSNEASAARPFAIADDWSFPSPSAVAKSSPHLTASRREATKPVAELDPGFSPALFKKTRISPPYHVDAFTDTTAEPDPTNMAQIRAARLRHFKKQADRIDEKPTPRVFTSNIIANYKTSPGPDPAGKQIVKTKIVEIECIDLTDD